MDTTMCQCNNGHKLRWSWLILHTSTKNKVISGYESWWLYTTLLCLWIIVAGRKTTGESHWTYVQLCVCHRQLVDQCGKQDPEPSGPLIWSGRTLLSIWSKYRRAPWLIPHQVPIAETQFSLNTAWTPWGTAILITRSRTPGYRATPLI